MGGLLTAWGCIRVVELEGFGRDWCHHRSNGEEAFQVVCWVYDNEWDAYNDACGVYIAVP